MKFTPISAAREGERVLAVVPEFRGDLVTSSKRLNLFTGRSLSHVALQAEQRHRNGHLASLGQLRSTGVVSGLVVAEELPTTAEKVVQISAGRGLRGDGEDVWLPRPVRVSLNQLPVRLSLKTSAPLAEVLSGDDTASELRTFVLLLQPVTLSQANKFDPNRCTDWDDSARAYEDERSIDGVRLILHPWEGEEEGTGAAASQWRNRLAYAIFQRELDEQPLPWQAHGVPIALIALTSDQQRIAFVDGFAVVRSGGRPLPRRRLAPGGGDAYLAQARVQQFAEQIAELAPEGDTLAQQQQWVRSVVAPRFRYLPPVGLLPRAAGTPRSGGTYQDHFFPANYRSEVAPIPQEQLELVLRDSAVLAPYDLTQADQVQIWVPVPQAWYEPDLLEVKQVDPLFQQRISEFQLRRAEWLIRRELVRERAIALTRAITGEAPQYALPDQNRLPDEDLVPFSSSLVLLSPVVDSPEDDAFFVLKQEESTLSLGTGDRLSLYVWIDPDAPPISFEIWWYLDQVFSHRVYWGNVSIEDRVTRRLMGSLPEAGEWVRMDISASHLGLEEQSLFGMAVRVVGGRMAIGHVGKRAATTEAETIWLGDSLPTGAIADEATFPRNKGWSWVDPDTFQSLQSHLASMLTRETQRRQKPFASNRALVSNLATDDSFHALKNASDTLSIAPGDWLSVHVYIDPLHPPERIEIWWLTTDPDRRLRRVYWGTPTRWGRGAGHTEEQARGALSALEVGRWVRLEVAAAELTLEGSQIDGMAFLVNGGRAAWAAAGKYALIGSARQETVWIGDSTPAGASVVTDPGWQWVTLAETSTPLGDDLPPLLTFANIKEEDYGTSEPPTGSGGSRVVTAMTDLRSKLLNQSPIDRDAIYVEHWPSTAVIPEDLRAKVSYNQKTKNLIIQGVLLQTEKDALYEAAVSASTDPPLSDDQKASIENAINDLYSRSQDNTTLKILDEKGLNAFIRFLEEKVSQADDQVEFGFLNVRTNMYRLRQQVLTQEDASRLAISPTLADIAKRESSVATQADLSTYFNSARERTVPAPVATGTSGAGDVRAPESAEARVDPRARDDQLMAAAAEGLSSGERSAFPGSRVDNSSELRRSVVIGDALRSQNLGIAREVEIREDLPLLSFQPSKGDVVEQAPIIGRVSEIVTVAERLKQPAPIETRDYSLKGRKTVVDNFSQIGIFRDLPVPESAKHLNFGQIKAEENGLGVDEDDDLDTTINNDEVLYFSSAVRALDRTVAALRLGEGRTQQYRQAINICRNALAHLEGLQHEVSRRLRIVETELAEARHDVSVARTLLAEEEERVGRINSRRDRILEEHVTYLAYQRPRTADLLVPPPWRSLDPGVSADPLVPCLGDDHPIPRELQAMTNLLREAPLSWFPGLNLDRVDDIESQVALVTTAKRQVSLKVHETVITTGNTPIAASINRIYAQKQQQLDQQRQVLEQLDLRSVAVQSWRESRRQSEQLLTLGDLLTASHLQPEISDAAARLLNALTRVATCLYARFEAVTPALRLGWAERLSQFDTAVPLRTLTNLPRWGEIASRDRRDMQTLVDWLFQRINPAREDAIAFLDDLIRLCALLASHAPVNQIITGRVLKPATVSRGGRVQISIDSREVRIGMPVLVYSATNAVVAQGVVDDLSGGLASTRITSTTQSSLNLTEATRVQLLRQPLR